MIGSRWQSSLLLRWQAKLSPSSSWLPRRLLFSFPWLNIPWNINNILIEEKAMNRGEEENDCLKLIHFWTTIFQISLLWKTAKIAVVLYPFLFPYYLLCNLLLQQEMESFSTSFDSGLVLRLAFTNRGSRSLNLPVPNLSLQNFVCFCFFWNILRLDPMETTWLSHVSQPRWQLDKCQTCDWGYSRLVIPQLTWNWPQTYEQAQKKSAMAALGLLSYPAEQW